MCEIKNDDAKEKESKCVTENGNRDLTVMEKDTIVMKEKGMVKHNKDVCEIKEDTKFAGEKERDSVCVIEQGKNDLTMMEKEKEYRCVMENRNNDVTVMEKDNIAMKKKGKVKHKKMSVRLKKIQNLQGKRKVILYV